jgi:hypothetical protein
MLRSPGVLDFSPDMGFVQPGLDFMLQIRFRPTPDLPQQCGKYALQNKVGDADATLVWCGRLGRCVMS